MKMFSLFDSEWKLAKIDALVNDGVFSSKTEVYRTGALLMCVMQEAREISKLDKLNVDLFGKEARIAIQSIKSKNYEIAYSKLLEISEALKLRGVLSPLLDNVSAKDDFETLSISIKEYADVLSRFEEHDENTQVRIIEDIKRDLSAIISNLENIEGVQSETVETPKYVRRFVGKPVIRHTFRNVRFHNYTIVRSDKPKPVEIVELSKSKEVESIEC